MGLHVLNVVVSGVGRKKMVLVTLSYTFSTRNLGRKPSPTLGIRVKDTSR